MCVSGHGTAVMAVMKVALAARQEESTKGTEKEKEKNWEEGMGVGRT